jgi:hypothetical protein
MGTLLILGIVLSLALGLRFRFPPLLTSLSRWVSMAALLIASLEFPGRLG